MSTSDIQTNSEEDSQGVVAKVSGLINALAVRCESSATFYRRASAAIVQGFQSPYGAISVRFGAEIVEDYWHTGSTDPKFWKKPVDDLLNESMQEAKPYARQFSARDAAFQIALISIILRNINGSMIGVMSVVVRCTDEFTAPMYRELLETLSGHMAAGAARIEEAAKSPPENAPDANISKAAKYTSGVEMAFALVSNLRGKLGCEQVAIGTSDGSKIKVQSVSGLDEVSDRAEAVRLMSDAMGEAADRGKRIVFQKGSKKEEKNDSGFRVHKRWHDGLGGACLVSIPLDAGNGDTMIVSLRRRVELPYNSEELDNIETLMTPYAPAFGLVNRANCSLMSHTSRSVKTTTKGVFSPQGWGRKILAIVLLATTAWIGFGTIGYSINAPATVRPSVVRNVSSPIHGTLISSLATVGDHVMKGQVLAVFDDRELQTQREQLLAEIAILLINENKAISENAGVEAGLARAEQRLAQARLSEIDRQISQSQIVAPIDGLVMNGDLRSRIGETMPLGTPMFEIAETGSWTLDIQMPQRVAADLEAGRVGSFAPNAKPEEQTDLQLMRIHPLAQPVNGKTVYIAEAHLSDSREWIKPGMEGIARVEFGDRPVWWVVTHRFADYFRTNFWL